MKKADVSHEYLSALPIAKLCTCAAAMLRRLGGEHTFLRVLLMAPPTAEGALSHNEVYLDASTTAVNKGLALEGWGVVNRAKHTCHTCPPRRSAAHSTFYLQPICD